MIHARKTANLYRNLVLLFSLLGIFFVVLGWIITGIISFLIVYLFFTPYHTWRVGAEGEEKVISYLSELPKSYVVLNDIKLPSEHGNIDHIVLGSNGIFAIETKNHKGRIFCDGDFWQQEKVGRSGTTYIGNLKNPSGQVKRQAMLLKELLSKHGTALPRLWVDAIVVFTNEEAVLDIINPTVKVLKVEDLCRYIRDKHSNVRLTKKQINDLRAIIEDVA